MEDPAIVVLRSDAFASAEQLAQARAAIPGPVLFLLHRHHPDDSLGDPLGDPVTAALTCARPTDDLAFHDDPPELIEFRRRRLLRHAAPAPAAGPAGQDATAAPGVDPLTTLLDRASLLRAVAAAELPAALLVINLDHFKRHNDQLGHLVGDQLLRLAAERTRAASPPDAIIARIGGDVFAVALASHHSPHLTAAAIRAAISTTPLLPDAPVTASIGLVARTTETSFEELLRRAEGALYAAKARGRDRIVEHAEREREARARDGDLELDGFEELTRVLADRVADVISSRGRRVFQGLRDQADLDALTGLHSRRYLDRRLGFELAHAQQRHARLALGLLDVDHFGEVNKRFGWPTGDRVLADVAARIRATLRGTDWAARYGGEEICIILDDVDLPAAQAALERLRATIAATPFTTTQDGPVPITVSIGCAVLGPDDSAAQLLERASASLLLAKRGGRDRVC